MTPMASKIVFLTSSALGVAALGATAYLVKHPQGFVSPPVVDAEPMPAPSPPIAVPEPAPAETRAVELEPVVITAKPSPAPAAPRTQRAAKPAPAEREATKPCSDWHEMGPTYVEDGEASGVRRVRELC